MKRIIFIVIMVVLVINTTGCIKMTNNKGQAKVGIRGQITEVLLDNSKVVSAIMVEGKVESDTSYDKAMIRIDKGTIINKSNTGEKLSVGELKAGMRVEVVFEGPVAESYPVQGKAKIIRTID